MTIWLAGDSTVAPTSGWGVPFARYATQSVRNIALSGSSSKSFREDVGSAWAAQFQRYSAAGDYVLIQFGHNDSKPEAYRHTEPGTAPDYADTYRAYLSSYVTDAQARGVIPILVTSVSRMVWTDGVLDRSHGSYPPAMRKLAADLDVTLIDLEETSWQAFSALGETVTLAQFSDGVDLTHFPARGGWKVARMVVGLLRLAGLGALCKACTPTDYASKAYSASAFSVCK